LKFGDWYVTSCLAQDLWVLTIAACRLLGVGDRVSGTD